MKEVYRIGGHVVEIDSLYQQVHELCRDYRDDGRPELCVSTTCQDIERERGRDGDPSAEYLETLAVYRKISEKMPYYNTILFHGSAVAVDGRAVLFAAPSGVGKSTHARLWRELLGDHAVMINDDKPLLHVGTDVITVFGTPWNGKHRLGENLEVPLRAICLLKRAEKNTINPICKTEAYPMLLQQIYRPSDPEALKKTLQLCDRLAEQTDLYSLACNMSLDGAALSYHTVFQ